MPYLDTYTEPLTADTASHLLRRACFGPTRQEIADFTGKTATDAVNVLISNVSRTRNPLPPLDYDETMPTAGQPFLSLPYNLSRTDDFARFYKFWWSALMVQKNGYPSVHEKLTLFWQNHFVVPQIFVLDYRFMDRYLRLLRDHCLGNFRFLATEVTKDPAMLLFQNGNENQKGHPNENYARELQELFVVGQKDFYGNENYTEEDVKAAANVLTGWQATNYLVNGSTTFGSVFTPGRHDTSDKTFSEKYNNTVISGQSGPEAGNSELNSLMSMLLAHPHTPKHICRKLYRWYVNPNVTEEIELNVIVPLAAFFCSPENNFNIEPVLRKLLSSQIFFDQKNKGAIIKSPADLVISMLRFFDQPVPDSTTEYVAFRKYAQFAYAHMREMDFPILDQPTVFGYPAYYQIGYSKNWINGTSIGRRHNHMDRYFWAHYNYEIKPGYILGIDLLAWLARIQPNFSDVAGTPAITCEQLLEAFSENLYTFPLDQSQKDFLIDNIMMRGVSRRNWVSELNYYRQTPDHADRKHTVEARCRYLLRHMFRMAEFHVS
jgi:hypothetical protein